MSAEIAWLIAYEGYAYFTHRRLLSHAVWDGLKKYPGIMASIALFIGMLLGHWLW